MVFMKKMLNIHVFSRRKYNKELEEYAAIILI